jgi:hypothetical protein
VSDNPQGGDNELLNLSVGMDTAPAQAQFDAFIAHIESRQAEALEALGKGDDAAYQFVNDLQEIKEAAFKGGEGIADLRKEVEYVTESFEKMHAVAAAGPDINQLALGYGVKGGVIGPAEATEEDAPGLGSSYALGRGARAIGQLTGNQTAGNAVADVLYIRQAFDQLQEALGSMNATVTASPGLIGGVASGLAEMGLPMAGLVTLGLPVAAALGGVAYELNEVKRIADEGHKALETADQQLLEFYKLIESGTSAQIRTQLAGQEDLKAGLDKTIANNKDILNQQIEDAGKRAGLSDEKIAQYQSEAAQGKTTNLIANLPVDASPAIVDLTNQTKALSDQSNLAATNITNYRNALGATSVAANDAAEAARQQADDFVKRTQQFAADDRLSSDAAKEKIALLAKDKEAQETVIAGLYKANEAEGISEEQRRKNIEAINEHAKQLLDDTLELKHLTDESVYIIQAREAEADAIKKTKEALDDLYKAQDTGEKQLADLTIQTANSRETAKLRELQAEEQYTQGSIQDAFERSKIALAESRKETEIKQQTADKLDDLSAKMDDDINKSWRDLGRKLTEDTTKSAEDIGKINREEGYKEREAQIDHLQKLADIQRKQKDGESDALYDRNFRELSKIQSHKGDVINEENHAYEERVAQDRRHTQDLINERTIRLNEEMAAQRRANAAKVQEILIAEREQETQIAITEGRKIQTLRTGEQQQLADLTAFEIYKTQLLRQGFQNELNLLTVQEAQRERIIRNTLLEAQIKATQSLPSIRPAGLIGSDGIREFDSGGSFNAGEKFLMSENNPERLDIGSHSYNIGGAALVMPLTSGSVTNPQREGGSRGPVTISIGPIYGASDPERTAQMIEAKLEARIEELFPQ